MWTMSPAYSSLEFPLVISKATENFPYLADHFICLRIKEVDETGGVEVLSGKYFLSKAWGAGIRWPIGRTETWAEGHHVISEKSRREVRCEAVFSVIEDKAIFFFFFCMLVFSRLSF